MKQDLTAKESSCIFVIGFLLCQILVLLANIIGIVICASQGLDTSTIELFFNSAVGYLICASLLDLGMIICYIYSKNHYNMTSTTKPSIKKCILYAFVGLLSFLALYPIVSCIDTLIASWGFTYPNTTYPYTTVNYFISIISLVILPAVCEELLFRGVIFSGLKRYGKWLSIIITSLMFAIFHMSIYQTIYPILFGILLAGIMYKEDNIIYCIIAHAINNFTSLTLSYLNVSLIFNHWTYILLAIFLCISWLIITILFINRNKSSKTKLSKTEATFLSVSFTIMLILWLITISIR